MSLLDIIRLLNSYKKILLILPATIAIIVYVLTSSQPQVYRSHMLIHTGIVPSGNGANENNPRVDVYAVNNAFDNLQTIIFSRQVMEETGLRLMAEHLSTLVTKPTSLENSLRNYWEEQPNELKAFGAITPEATYQALLQNQSSIAIQKQLEEETSLYSYATLKKGLQLKRSGSSDIIELSYQSIEASICSNTLLFLADAFTKRFREIRKSEAGNMVAFFEQEVNKAAQQLSSRGEEMKEFQKANRIINYYEQTHLTAIETEHLNGQFYEEQMKLAAAEGALNELQLKVGNSLSVALSSQSIINSQELLASLHTRKLMGSNSTDSTEYKIQREELKLRKELDHLYVDGRTEEGVSKKDVLKQWLEQFIKVSEARARVTVMSARKTEQEKMYDFYAPLGSKLHNYERQIDVAEREYLDLLHSLNQARLKQQSVENSNTLSIVDPPFLPLKAEPSKRKLLVVIGWLGTLLILIGSILTIEYIDSTLQSPERAEIKTGLEVIGALADTRHHDAHLVSWRDFTTRILTHIYNSDSKQANVIMLAKRDTTSCESIAAELRQKLGQLFDRPNVNSMSSWDEVIYQKGLTDDTSLLLYVCPGNYTWTSADQKSIELLHKATGIKPHLLLHGLDSEKLEGWIGEIPKERSPLRKFVKRMVKFQFH